MPYKDPEIARIKLNERKRRLRIRKKIEQFGNDPGDLRGKHGHHPRGNKSYLWNPGKLFTQDGYVLIRVGINHPLADPNGYASEHLLVWVSAGNPIPGSNELLHHKDENRNNNRIENLVLHSRGYHNSHHNKLRGRDKYGRFLSRNQGRTWNELPKGVK